MFSRCVYWVRFGLILGLENAEVAVCVDIACDLGHWVCEDLLEAV